MSNATCFLPFFRFSLYVRCLLTAWKGLLTSLFTSGAQEEDTRQVDLPRSATVVAVQPPAKCTEYTALVFLFVSAISQDPAGKPADGQRLDPDAARPP